MSADRRHHPVGAQDRLPVRPEVLDNLGLTPPSAGRSGFSQAHRDRCNLALPSDMLMLDRERSTAAFRIFQDC